MMINCEAGVILTWKAVGQLVTGELVLTPVGWTGMSIFIPYLADAWKHGPGFLSRLNRPNQLSGDEMYIQLHGQDQNTQHRHGHYKCFWKALRLALRDVLLNTSVLSDDPLPHVGLRKYQFETCDGMMDYWKLQKIFHVLIRLHGFGDRFYASFKLCHVEVGYWEFTKQEKSTKKKCPPAETISDIPAIDEESPKESWIQHEAPPPSGDFLEMYGLLLPYESELP
jgi:hypothetical protein